MYNSLLEEQIKDAKINFNYFFMEMILKIIKVFAFLICILLINQIFDFLFINIITLLFVLCSIYIIYKIINNYNYFLNDIKHTLFKESFSYVLDTEIIKDTFLKGVVKYGK